MKLERGAFAVKDGWPPRPLKDDPRGADKVQETILPSIEDGNVIVYRDAPVEMVKHYIRANPERFVLIDTPPIMQGVPTATGGVEWKMFYPWTYKVKPDGTVEWTEQTPEVVKEAEKDPDTAPRTPQDVVRLEQKAAAEVLGEDGVLELERAYRQQISKPKGLFSKNECYEFIDGLRKAVKDKKTADEQSVPQE